MNNFSDIERSLGRLEGKVDSIIERLDKINGSLGNHDRSINELKLEVGQIKTKSAMFGAGAGFGIMVLWEYLKSRFFK